MAITGIKFGVPHISQSSGMFDICKITELPNARLVGGGQVGLCTVCVNGLCCGISNADYSSRPTLGTQTPM